MSAADNMFTLEKSVAITVFLMIGCFLFSWTPYAIVSIVSALGIPKSISTFGTTLPGIFAKCSTVWNPIIYVIRNGEFRQSLILTLFRMSWRKKGTARSSWPGPTTTSGDTSVKSSNRVLLPVIGLETQHKTTFPENC